jgi:hypothetical protein
MFETLRVNQTARRRLGVRGRETSVENWGKLQDCAARAWRSAPMPSVNEVPGGHRNRRAGTFRDVLLLAGPGFTRSSAAGIGLALALNDCRVIALGDWGPIRRLGRWGRPERADCAAAGISADHGDRGGELRFAAAL